MASAESITHTSRPLQKLAALLCIGLVMFLGMAGASAELHAQLHARQLQSCHDEEPGKSVASAEHQDLGCVVDLFAQGVSFSVEQPRVSAAEVLGESLYQTVATQAAPTKPAGLLPPACGPPLK